MWLSFLVWTLEWDPIHWHHSRFARENIRPFSWYCFRGIWTGEQEMWLARANNNFCFSLSRSLRAIHGPCTTSKWPNFHRMLRRIEIFYAFQSLFITLTRSLAYQLKCGTCLVLWIITILRSCVWIIVVPSEFGRCIIQFHYWINFCQSLTAIARFIYSQDAVRARV